MHLIATGGSHGRASSSNTRSGSLGPRGAIRRLSLPMLPCRSTLATSEPNVISEPAWLAVELPRLLPFSSEARPSASRQSARGRAKASPPRFGTRTPRIVAGRRTEVEVEAVEARAPAELEGDVVVRARVPTVTESKDAGEGVPRLTSSVAMSARNSSSFPFPVRFSFPRLLQFEIPIPMTLPFSFPDSHFSFAVGPYLAVAAPNFDPTRARDEAALEVEIFAIRGMPLPEGAL